MKSDDPQPSSRSLQLGGLDLGSNSFHLLVAQEAHGRIQILDKHKEMVRLAEGLNETNGIQPQVMERALDCLSRLAQRLKTVEPENLRIVGTNTLRKAKNAKSFIKSAEKILGHKIEIIAGHEEARLIYLGVCHDLGSEDAKRLVIDIGGGSTELILGHQATPIILESLHMGCVSMSQDFFKNGKITQKRIESAMQHARSELEPIQEEFLNQQWDATVGASGTINAVNSVIQQHLGHSDITAEALHDLRQLVINAGSIDNLELPGLSEERRPVFVGGLVTLSAIFEALHITQMTAAQSALREGLIYDLLGRHHHNDVREDTIKSIVERYHIDQQHADAVSTTATQLLKQVAKKWDLEGSHFALLLKWAAKLHEVGMDISHSGFHKHGSYLIENMDMPGFSQTDQLQLASLVRTHRRKLASQLFPDEELKLQKLAALLRLAALLHRSRSNTTPPTMRTDARGNTLKILFPQNWLEAHPLTHHDLVNEAGYIKQVGLHLKFSD